MPPKRRPPTSKTTSVSQRSTRRNPLPPTPKNADASISHAAKDTHDVELVEAHPLKKGDRSRSLAAAKIVDSPEVIELSSPRRRSSPKKPTSSKSFKSTKESETTVNKKTTSKDKHNNDDDDDDYEEDDNEDDEDDDDDDASFNTAADDDIYDDEKASDVDDYANLSGLDDSEDELRTSFQKNKIIAKNRVIGGPTPPDYSGMSEQEAELAMKEYNKVRKAYTDKLRNDRVKANKSTVTNNVYCSGVTIPRLRSIVEVETNRLLVGRSFPDKNMLQLQVAEEANRCRIKIWTERSDHFNYIVFGERFCVAA
jgi:hypothetical protein